MSVSLRPYQPADRPRICQIAVEAFDGVSIDQGIEKVFGPIGGHNWQWRKARQIEEDLTIAPGDVFVAEEDGTVVAFITARRDTEAGLGFIPNLSVAAGYRGRGLGRMLIEHVLDHFRAHGLTHARIETLVQNDAGYGLYSSIGFKEVARQVHFAMELEPSPRDRETS